MEGSKATGPGKGPFNVPGSDEPACRRGSSAVLELVAAEEARSSAGGKHPQVLPRANAARTGARPAPFRRKDGSAEIVPLHANPAWVQDSTAMLSFREAAPSSDRPGSTGIAFGTAR